MANWFEQRRREVIDRGPGEDYESEGPFSGVGPKGYLRSDERIREDVCDRMMAHGQLDAHGIEVEVREGEVWLRGEVDNRGAKRLAENIADAVPGVLDVHNRLKIVGLTGRKEWAEAAAKAGQGQEGIDWRREIRPGMSVIGSDGSEVGRVKEVRPSDFLVDRPMARDAVIPYPLIDNLKNRTLMLLVRSDQVGSAKLDMKGNLAGPYDDKTIDENKR